MHKALLMACLFLLVPFAGCLADDSTRDADGRADAADGRERPVVLAVVDSGFNPYHWDFLAEHMPQHNDGDAATDLPLWDDPADWLPGFPGRDAFASYTALNLTLTPDDPDAVPSELYEQDEEAWSTVKSSTSSAVHFHHIPGTKVVGYLNFGSGDGFAPASHGGGSSSVSVGNYYGSCPECLLVFVNGLSDAVVEWVASQDWIDLQTNSWGSSSTPVVRDRIWSGSDLDAQRSGVERGQQIFFSAGNGINNDFVTPNPTLFSSQEGPDWIVTVGAIHPVDGSSYSGHGKPADVASVGSGYARAGGGTVTAEGSFGGTSNATPVTAGLYAAALHRLRNEWADAPRMQVDGVLATGPAGCGDADPDCPLADGRLTVHGLRDALLRAAYFQPTHWNVGGTAPLPYAANTQETDLLAAGHGAFWGRHYGDGLLQDEVDRIVAIVRGELDAPRTSETQAWFEALSFCRQGVWGSWDHGQYQGNVPGPDPEWPTRTFFATQCPTLVRAVVDAAAMTP